MIIVDYIAENWVLILVLLGFAVSLISTVFMDQRSIRRLFVLIVQVFLLSILVFVEFRIAGRTEYRTLRIVLMAIRYSATPFIIAQTIYAVVKNQRWYIFLPAAAVAVVDFISIFTGIVFSLDSANKLVRGPLGLLPFIAAGIYCAYMIFVMIINSSKQMTEVVPIVFFAGAFGSGLLLPFIIGSDYSQIFCSTIAVSIFVYYVFTILDLTKRDALTGLLNRQAYYADVRNEPGDITALISIDMNGLKAINDNEGHKAGDLALSTLSNCFLKAARKRYRVYRVGGDEFVIVCRRCTENDVIALCSDIQDQVSATKYSCSVGYSISGGENTSIDELLKESDDNMYAAKEKYYQETGTSR